MVAGGNGARKSIEHLNLKTKKHCKLPSLPNDRYGHTLDHGFGDGLLVCGGCEKEYCQKQCLTFIQGKWNISHNLSGEESFQE